MSLRAVAYAVALLSLCLGCAEPEAPAVPADAASVADLGAVADVATSDDVASADDTAVAAEIVADADPDQSDAPFVQADVIAADSDSDATVATGCAGDGNCPKAQFCQNALCVPDVCTAGEIKCTDVDHVGQCAANGSGSAESACPSGQKCEAGGCKPKICEPDVGTCKDDVLHKCSATGVSEVVTDCAKSDKVCDQGQCKPPICTPGTNSCKSGHSATCDAKGLTWKLNLCLDGKVCIDGQCEQAKCKANELFCLNKQVHKCNGTATGSTITTDCVADGKVCDLAVCVVPLCKPGAVQCQGANQLTCAATAMSWDAVACQAGEVCSEGACVPVICTANTSSCQGNTLLQCDNLGVKSIALKDCAASQQVCDGGQCKSPICAPGELLCQGLQLGTCNTKGLGWNVSPCAGGTACSEGKCQPIICTPGAKTCVGEAVHVCNALGVGNPQTIDCAATGEVCDTGTCQAPICSVGAKECQGGLVATCSAKGLLWSKAGCPPDQACDKGSCQPIVCTPGDKVCTGDKLHQCDAKGLASPVVQDCGSEGKICDQGQCKATICVVGAKECQSGALATCINKGLQWQAIACSSGQVCVDGACKTGICQAFAKLCVGNVASVCDGTGTATSPVNDCGSAGQVCDKGLCKQPICTPGALQCQSGALATCDSKGLVWVPQACPANNACVVGKCKPIICTANAKTCDGDKVRLCDGDGVSNPVAQDCVATKQICHEGACKTQVCLPSSTTCTANELLSTCDSLGLSSSTAGCGIAKTCDAGQCKPTICQPNALACDGDKVRQCDGKGLTQPVVQDCVASKQICYQGGCKSLVCAPNSSTCMTDAFVSTCDALGLTTKLSACAAGKACDLGVCLPIICKPGDKICDVDKLRQCDSKGVNYTLVQDCVSSGQVCDAVQCKKPICLAGIVQCQTNTDLGKCDAKGLNWVLTACGSGKACELGVCKNQICTPGAISCSGTVAMICDAKGLATTAVQNCATTGLACELGVCKPMICTPNAKICKANQIATCDSTGLKETLSNCLANQSCDLGVCKNQICTPDAGSCSGTTAQVCDSKGLVLTSVKNCATTGLACETGVCKPMICTPNAKICKGNQIATCDAIGLKETLSDCLSTQSCDVGVCKNKICVPAATICNVLTVQTCDAKGLAYVTTTDCAKTSEMCDKGACAAPVCWPPGSKKCYGPQVGTCKADASGPDLVVCDDKDACTNNTCDDVKVVCAYPALQSCDDANVCTADSCDKATGKCVNTAAAGSCTDGDGCTTADSCVSGKCAQAAYAYSIETVAGGETAGSTDAGVASATFDGLTGLVWRPDGAWVLVDTNNHRVRRISAAGVVTTSTGTSAGFANGLPDVAKMSGPTALAGNVGGFFYVADTANHRIRKLSPANYLATFAGFGTAGYLDGPGAGAQFSAPSGLALDPKFGWLYVSDTGNQRMRIVKPDGTVSTLAGSGTAGFGDGAAGVAKFNGPAGIALLPGGSLAVADTVNLRIRKVAADGTVSTLAGTGVSGALDGAATTATFSALSGALVALPSGELLIGDGAKVRMLANGQVTTIAGGGGTKNSGPALQFKLNAVRGLALASNGRVGVTDGYALRMITLTNPVQCDDKLACTNDSCDKPTGKCAFVGAVVNSPCDDGSACITSEACDGKGACVGTAKSCEDNNTCTGDACDPFTGSCDNGPAVATCEDGNACTQTEACLDGKCALDLVSLTTLAGTSQGYGDGIGSSVKFSTLTKLLIAADGTVYAIDAGNHVIRAIAKDGKVTTVAGIAGKPGNSDGQSLMAQFNSPTGAAFDGQGRIVVSDYTGHRIRLFDPKAGIVSTVAGSGIAAYTDGVVQTASLSNPTGVAVDKDGAIYVADRGNFRIRKIANGQVSTVAGSGGSGKLDGAALGATFSSNLYGLAIGPTGGLYIADTGNNAIRSLVNGQVATWAGVGSGYVDGTLGNAKFSSPLDIAFDQSGQAFVTDTGNLRIRRISTKGEVSTYSGNGAQAQVDGLGTKGSYFSISWLGVGSLGGVYVSDYYRVRKLMPAQILCDDGASCTADSCDTKTGLCSNAVIGEGQACSDDNACTVGEVCTASSCKGGAAKSCDDGDVCTLDWCDAALGCVNSTAGGDGTPCDVAKFCEAGVCKATACPGSPPAVAQKGEYTGAPLVMDTKGSGGGYSPKYKEYWYPQWSIATVHRYDAKTLAPKGTFSSGQEQMMQLWGESDGSYYTANWGYNTVTKKADMAATTLWAAKMNGVTGGVAADASYVYAMLYTGTTQVVLLHKATGAPVGTVKLVGGTTAELYGGMAVVGDSIYRGDATNTVSRHNKVTGVLIDQFAVQGTLGNVAFNGREYCVSANSSQVYCYAVVKAGTGCL